MNSLADTVFMAALIEVRGAGGLDEVSVAAVSQPGSFGDIEEVVGQRRFLSTPRSIDESGQPLRVVALDSLLHHSVRQADAVGNLLGRLTTPSVNHHQHPLGDASVSLASKPRLQLIERVMFHDCHQIVLGLPQGRSLTSLSKCASPVPNFLRIYFLRSV